ncbi:MAG: bifunctional DNA-formamidopyrimidine glycosylase/DNA-(apurinic or apyrimidinic site) lyase [Propionibacteriaceae bacterium]|nr:bifunctional DNA-formamidopyrimidine glycosylase/DNA-(apurinic or apyrimidinic site) lyase [Propionibacteriaceae bacterium]
MPELPEVETIRAGLESNLVGLRIAEVKVFDSRAVKQDVSWFAPALIGRTITGLSRRGKYLWFNFGMSEVLLAHLGMSGQFRIDHCNTLRPTHTRVEFGFCNTDLKLRFIDQRLFGGLRLGETDQGLPVAISHIARDLLDCEQNLGALAAKMQGKSSGIKRVLLNQSVVSGIGNIYADESLWRASLHYNDPANTFTQAEIVNLLRHALDVLTEALAAGGTSFDALYVSVSGESGYFARSLQAYGREGQPCYRCEAPIVREPFSGRSSFRCPKCQTSRSTQ